MKRFLILSVLILSACMPPQSPANKKDEGAVSPLIPQAKRTPIDEKLAIYLDTVDGLPLSTKETCAESICGAVPARAAVGDGSELTARWTPLVRQLMISNAKTNAELINKLSDTDLSNARLTPKTKALVNLIWAHRYFKKARPAWKNMKFDKSKLQDVLGGDLAPTEISQVDKMLTAFLGNEDQLVAEKISAYGLQTYFSEKTASEDSQVIRSAITTYAQAIVARIRNLKNLVPGLPTDISPEMEALTRGEGLDVISSEAFASAIRSAAFDRVVGSDIATYSERTPDLASETALFLGKTAKVYRERDSHLSVQTDKFIKACTKTANHLMQIKTVETSAASRVQGLVEAVRSASIAIAPRFASDDETKQKITDALKSVRFKAPSMSADTIRKIDKALGDKTLDSDKTFSLIRNSDVQIQAVYMVLANLSADGDEDDDSTLCSARDPLSISDYTLTGMGLISIGWPTLIDAKGGYGILAHEFGHVVSAILGNFPQNSTSYDQVFDCVGQRKASVTQPNTQEEDFADLFSAQVLNTLEKSGVPLENQQCLVMRTMGSEGRWNSRRGLTMIYPSEIDDSHSPDFQRLLQIEINRGHALNAECTAVVSATIPQMTNQCSF